MVIQAPRKRFLLFLALALLFALASSVSAQIHVPTPAICNETGPGDWSWWLSGCWQFPAAFADLIRALFTPAEFKGFVVR